MVAGAISANFGSLGRPLDMVVDMPITLPLDDADEVVTDATGVTPPHTPVKPIAVIEDEPSSPYFGQDPRRRGSVVIVVTDEAQPDQVRSICVCDVMSRLICISNYLLMRML